MTDVRKRQLAWVAGISAVIALLAIWTFAIDWEWTYYGDDMSHLTRGREALAKGPLGLVGAIAEPFLLTDESRFRPLYWSFTTAAYQLGPTGIRIFALGTYLLSFIALIQITRRNCPKSNASLLIWVSALFLANYTLVYGLWVSSIQELWGVGLIALAALQTRLGWQAFWLFTASLMKEPFVFVLLTFGLIQLASRRLRLGVLLCLASAFELAFVIRGARLDGQAQSAFQLNPWHVWANLGTLGQGGALFLVVALIGLVAFAGRLHFAGNSLVFMTLGGAYAGSLLFWNTGGHYQPPVWYFLALGLAFSIKSQAPLTEDGSSRRSVVRFVVVSACLTTALLATAETFRTHVIGWNAMVNGARDWTISAQKQGTRVFLYNINEREFNFYLEETTRIPLVEPLVTWYPHLERPKITSDYEYVIVAGFQDLPGELTRCKAVRVWTQGFLAPLKC